MNLCLQCEIGAWFYSLSITMRAVSVRFATHWPANGLFVAVGALTSMTSCRPREIELGAPEGKRIVALFTTREVRMARARFVALASVALARIASRTPSYAATCNDCLRKIKLAASIDPKTSSTNTGKHTANSTVATPRRRARSKGFRRFGR